MRHTRITKSLVILCILIIWCLIPIQVYSAQDNPSSPTVAKPVKPPVGLKQKLFFVHGTIKTASGQGVKNIEVALSIYGYAGNIPSLLDQKVTDTAGRYAFTIPADKRGRRFKIAPIMPQGCNKSEDTKSCSFTPESYTFVFQDTMTVDFRIDVRPKPPVPL